MQHSKYFKFSLSSSVHVSPTCHDVGCSALVNSLPSLSYRLLSSSAPSISYTYMSVSEISTLKDRHAQTDSLGAHKLESISVNLFARQVLPSQLQVQWESIREKKTLTCWPMILSAGNFWDTQTITKTLARSGAEKQWALQYRDRLGHTTHTQKHTCRSWIVLSHHRTRMRTPGRWGTGLCVAKHPPAGNTPACRLADTLPAYPTRTTLFHPEDKVRRNKKSWWVWKIKPFMLLTK